MRWLRQRLWSRKLRFVDEIVAEAELASLVDNADGLERLLSMLPGVTGYYYADSRDGETFTAILGRGITFTLDYDSPEDILCVLKYCACMVYKQSSLGVIPSWTKTLDLRPKIKGASK